MISLAKSPLAPVLGQRIPLRGSARLLFVGVHTVRLARLAGRDGEVIAIEPDPDATQRARRNITLNGLSNVRVSNAAGRPHGLPRRS